MLWLFACGLALQPLAVLWYVASSGSSTQLWLGCAAWVMLAVGAWVYRNQSMPAWHAAKRAWSRWRAPVADPRWVGVQPLLRRLRLEAEGRPSLQRDVAEIARATYRLAAGREALLRSAATLDRADPERAGGKALARIEAGAAQLDEVLDQLCGALADLQVALAVPDGFEVNAVHAHIQDALERAQAALEVQHFAVEAPAREVVPPVRVAEAASPPVETAAPAPVEPERPGVVERPRIAALG